MQQISVILALFLILITGGAGQEISASPTIPSTPSSSSELSNEQPPASDSASSPTAELRLLRDASEATLLGNQDGRNLWQLTVPVTVPIQDAYKNREIAIIRILIPEEFTMATDPTVQYHQNSFNPDFPFYFKRSDAGIQTIDAMKSFTIHYLANSDWIKDEPDKLAVFAQRSLEHRYGPDNSISMEYWDVGETRWLVRCAFIFPEQSETGETNNFCSLRTIYKDQYDIWFHVTIGQHTLEDEDTRAEIIALLESFEVVSIDSVTNTAK